MLKKLTQNWGKGAQFLIVYLVFLSLMVQSSPLFFYLKDYQNNPRPTLTQNIADKVVDKAEAKENVSKRTANANFYETKDGKGYAIVSSNNVNFKNSQNQWQTIDNNLQKVDAAKNDGYTYQNTANKFSTKFKSNTASYFYEVKQGNYSLEFGLQNSLTSKPTIKDNKITYKNIQKNIDLQYLVDSDFVKNNIILEDVPDTDKLVFTLKTQPEMKLSQDKDGNINITNRDNSVSWTINPPSVYDTVTRNYVLGNYNIISQQAGFFTLEMPINQFLPRHDFGYPVVIDPTVVVGGTSSITDCAYVVDGSPDDRYVCSSAVPEFQVGKTSYGSASAYLKFNLPAELAGKTVDSAIFALTSKEERASIARINLYRVTSPWSQNSVSWQAKPSLGNSPESSYTNNNSYSWWNFDITNLTKAWVSGAVANNGVALVAQDPNVSRRNFTSQFFDSDTSLFRPYILVNYSTNPAESKLIGSHSWWQYVNTDLAEGSSNVNIASGNLNLSFTDVSSQGKGLDTIINHTYNSLDNYDGPYGYNWTISANKRLSFPNGNRQTVVYNDESDTQFTFYDDNNDNNYVDSANNDINGQSDFYRLAGHRPNGLNWGLKYDPASNQYIARTSDNSTIIFDSAGVLQKETDKNGNALTYNYLDGRLANITDASGLQVKFAYDGTGRLQQITDHNYNNPLYQSYGGKVTYEYQNGDLWKVHYYTGDTMTSTTTYSYANHQLISVTDNKNYITNYHYLNNKVYEIINPKLEKTGIAYDSSQGLTKVTSSKGYDTGNNPDDYTTYYYYRNNPYFQPGLVYKMLSPVVKNEAGVATRNQTEYDYSGDYQVTATVGPKYLTNSNLATITATAYDDVSGLPIYQYSANHILTAKNTYSYATYDNPNWKLLDSYDGNGVQTMFSYDQSGNLTRKGILDGDAVNLLHNPGFESVSRSGNFDPFCQFSYAGFVGTGDFWCPGQWKAGYQSYTTDTNDLQDGTKSQVLNINNNNATTTANVYQIPDEPLSMEPNTAYVLKWKYKINTPQIYMNVQAFHDDSFPLTKKPDGTVLHDNSIGSPVTSASYTNVNIWSDGYLEFTTPSYNTDGHPYWTTELFFRAIPRATGIQNGKVWIDSVSLQKKSNTANYTEKVNQFHYGSYGQILTETTPEGKTINYDWDNNGNLKSATDPLGNTTAYTYDDNGNKLTKTEPKGIATPDDPNDYKTVYAYNGRNQITAVTDAATGNQTTYTYDANGNLQDTITPNGLKTTVQYDELNRAQTTINPYGYSSKVEYDTNGNPKGITDPNKKTSSTAYDANDRPTQETDPTGKQTNTTYTANDDVKVLSVENQTLNYNYDNDGRLLTEGFNNNGAQSNIAYNYDNADNIIQTTNPTSDVIKPNYTTTNEITKISIGGTTAKYTYNKNNQLTRLDKQVDASNNPTGDSVIYGYNNNGQVENITHSRNNSNFQTYGYQFDPNGNRKQVTVNGQSTNYEYDNQNQLSKKTAPDGKVTQYHYDKGGNLTEIVYPDATKDVFFYDGNRLIKKIDKTGQTENFGYDANGNITSRDNGETTQLLSRFENNLQNDRDHQAATINDDSKITPTYIGGKFGQALRLSDSQYLSYSSSSNLNKAAGTVEFWFQPNWSADNQIRTLFEYFADSKNYIRLQKTADSKLQFAYVSNGKDYGATSDPISFQSGSWYHLAFKWSPTQSAIYLNGNKVGAKVYCQPNAWFCTIAFKKITAMAQKITLGASYVTTASQFADIALDELQISSVAKADVALLADSQATQSAKLTQTMTYEYDSDDYLTKITKPDGTIISYTYDSNKRLIKRKVDGANPAETTYLYDDDKVVSETTGSDVTKYLYDTNGNLLIIVKNGTNYYPVYDGLGSIVGIRDSAGKTINSYNYDEWGNATSKTEAIANPLQFASYRWDNDAQMYLLGARWYDPTLSRFVSVDPDPGSQDDAISLNEYIYCRNNPINYTDPDGKLAMAIPLVYFAAMAGLAVFTAWWYGPGRKTAQQGIKVMVTAVSNAINRSIQLLKGKNKTGGQARLREQNKTKSKKFNSSRNHNSEGKKNPNPKKNPARGGFRR